MTLLSETKTQLFRHNDHYIRRIETDRDEVTWEEMHVDHDEFREVTKQSRIDQLERIT